MSPKSSNSQARRRLKSPARIFIVDDHAMIRYGLRQLIPGELDAEVCGEAADADEAMAKLADCQAELAIVDISLQHGNGLDLIKRIKAHWRDLKILVYSMHEESMFAERALHAGALGYINKCEPAENLMQAIRQVLDGQIYLSAAMTDQLLHRLTAHQHDALKRPAIDLLSDRELEVYQMIGEGQSSRQIADALHLSIKTIETHREHIKEKLGLKNGNQIARHAVQWVLENP